MCMFANRNCYTCILALKYSQTNFIIILAFHFQQCNDVFLTENWLFSLNILYYVYIIYKTSAPKKLKVVKTSKSNRVLRKNTTKIRI